MIADLWLGPDLDADLLELVDYPDQWPNARIHCVMLQMFQQQIGADDPASYNPLPQWVADLIPNYYPRLANADFFERIKALDLPLAIETPGLKAWSPDGEQAAFALQTAFHRVRAAGYDISAFSLDDSLCAAMGDFPDSPWPLKRAVPAVVKVLQTGDANGVRGGLTEAYPCCSAAQIIRFMELIQQAGYSPSHLHMDVDEQAAKQKHTEAQISADLKDLQFHCHAWGIPFGIILNGQRGDDPQSYRTGFWEWFNFARRMLGGDPDRWILESWKKNNLPVNLPETSQFSHTGLLREVAALPPF